MNSSNAVKKLAENIYTLEQTQTWHYIQPITNTYGQDNVDMKIIINIEIG